MRIKEQRDLLQRVSALDKDCIRLLEFMEDVIKRYYGTEDEMLLAKATIIDYHIRPLEHNRLTEEEEKHLQKLEVRYTDFHREYEVYYDQFTIRIKRLSILTRGLYG